MTVGYFAWHVIRNRVNVPNLLISGLIIIALGLWFALARAHGVEPADSLDHVARVGIFLMILACAHTCRARSPLRRPWTPMPADSIHGSGYQNLDRY